MERVKAALGWIGLWAAFFLLFAWLLAFDKASGGPAQAPNVVFNAGASSSVPDSNQTWNSARTEEILPADAVLLSVFDRKSRLIVRISQDGWLTFGPGAPPEAQAREVWKVMAAAWPAALIELKEERCFRLLFGPDPSLAGP